MPNVCIASFPPILEMIYLKTLAVSILNALNRRRDEMGQKPVACGPLVHENESLSAARDEFNQSLKEEAMYQFFYQSLIASTTTAWWRIQLAHSISSSNMGKKVWRIRFHFV